MQQLKWPNTLADLEAAANEVRAAGSAAVVGYCWGGTVAHVAASDLDLDAAISYYGGGVAKMLDKKPRCPILYHFGDQDASIPLPDIEKIKARQSEEPVVRVPRRRPRLQLRRARQLQRERCQSRVRSLDRVLGRANGLSRRFAASSPRSSST